MNLCYNVHKNARGFSMGIINNKQIEIMDIAFTEFAQHGFNFSIVDVANLVGIKKQSLYNHIDSKDHLIRLIMIREIEAFFEEIPDVEALEEFDTVEKKLKHIFTSLIGIYSDYSRLRFWRWMTLFNVSYLLEDIRTLILTKEKDLQMLVVNLFKEGSQNGEIDPKQAGIGPQMFVTMVQGMMDGMITFNGKIDIEQYRDRMWQGYWYGIKMRQNEKDI